MKKSIKLTQIRGGLNFGGQRKETKRKQSQRNLVAKRISGPGPCATTSTTRTPPTTLRPPRHGRRQLCGSVLCGMPQELRPLIDLCHVPQLCCILPLPPCPPAHHSSSLAYLSHSVSLGRKCCASRLYGQFSWGCL